MYLQVPCLQYNLDHRIRWRVVKTWHVNYIWRISFSRFDPNRENFLTVKISSATILCCQCASTNVCSWFSVNVYKSWRVGGMWYNVHYTSLIPGTNRLTKSGNKNMHSFPDKTITDMIHVDQWLYVASLVCIYSQNAWQPRCRSEVPGVRRHLTSRCWYCTV